MNSGPPRERQWLQRLVGPGADEARVDTLEGPKTLKSSVTVRPLGDVWVLMEGQGEMPDRTGGSWLMLLGLRHWQGPLRGYLRR